MREAELQAQLRKLVPLYDHIDLAVEAARSGVYRCCVPLSDRTKNHFNTVHAAIQWASGEVLGGLVLLANFEVTELFAVVRRVSIEFMQPARSAIVAEAAFADASVAEIRRRLEADGEAEFSLEAVVTDESGQEVARTSATYLLRPLRPRD